MVRQLEIFFELHQFLFVFEIFNCPTLIFYWILRVYEIWSHCDDDVGTDYGAYASLLLVGVTIFNQSNAIERIRTTLALAIFGVYDRSAR
jgi:hypothetical protein